MDVMQSVITLFIEPDDGPIRPVKIDMLEIETDVVRMPLSLNRDQERIKVIAAKIKAAFPKVQPEARMQDLRSLITRLGHAAIYDGVVLHLPGSIDGPSTPKNPGQEVFDQLSAEGLQLKTDLQKLVNKFKELQNDNNELKAENTRLANSEKNARDALQPVKEALKSKENDEYKARVEVAQIKKDLADMQQQYAALQVQLEKAKLDLQTAARDQQEVAQLRQIVAGFRTKEQNLNDGIARRDRDIKKLEQDLEDLRRGVKQLMDQGQGQAARPRVKDEPRKDPYLD
jgi:uncharacterized phage infection (PIP) family protein YhgE